MKRTTARQQLPRAQERISAHVAQNLRELAAVRTYAAAVLANGVLSDDEGNALELAEAIALARGAGVIETAFLAFENSCGKADAPDLLNWFYDYAELRARSAYQLGLAVGQQLGPGALQGGR